MSRPAAATPRRHPATGRDIFLRRDGAGSAPLPAQCGLHCRFFRYGLVRSRGPQPSRQAPGPGRPQPPAHEHAHAGSSRSPSTGVAPQQRCDRQPGPGRSAPSSARRRLERRSGGWSAIPTVRSLRVSVGSHCIQDALAPHGAGRCGEPGRAGRPHDPHSRFHAALWGSTPRSPIGLRRRGEVFRCASSPDANGRSPRRRVEAHRSDYGVFLAADPGVDRVLPQGIAVPLASSERRDRAGGPAHGSSRPGSTPIAVLSPPGTSTGGNRRSRQRGPGPGCRRTSTDGLRWCVWRRGGMSRRPGTALAGRLGLPRAVGGARPARTYELGWKCKGDGGRVWPWRMFGRSVARSA
jgi:hypothetical protein